MFLIDKSYWEIKKTSKKGRGVFAKKKIVVGTIIGDYVGKLLSLEDIDFEKENKNMYLMYYDDYTGIYPNFKKPGVCLLNHSCFPNCFIKTHKKHALVFALRDIKVGEELTIHYLLPPKEHCKNCTHQCFCKSKYCTGTMHLTEDVYQGWQKFQSRSAEDSNANKKTLKPLKDYPEKINRNHINKIRRLFKLSQP